MKKIKTINLLIVIISAVLLITPLYSLAQSNYSTTSSQINANSLISLTNQTRSQNGLQSLAANSKLNQAAYAKANDMISNNYFAHTSPSGIMGWHFIRGQGYAYSKAGENLAKDFMTSQGVFNGWMASPTHRANILEPGFKEIGIAVKTGFINNKATTVTVQMFGIPLGNNSVPSSTSQNATNNYASPKKQLNIPRLTTPKNNAYLNSEKLIIEGKAERNQIINISIGQHNLTINTDDQGKFKSKPDIKLKNSDYKIKIKARDYYQNTSKWSKNIIFNINNNPPKINRIIESDPKSNKKTIIILSSEKLKKAALTINQKPFDFEKYNGPFNLLQKYPAYIINFDNSQKEDAKTNLQLEDKNGNTADLALNDLITDKTRNIVSSPLFDQAAFLINSITTKITAMI